MTRAQIEVLQTIGVAGVLPKSYFDAFPGRKRIVKNLMWDGYVEAAGVRLDDVKLTLAGRFVLSTPEGA